MPERSGKPLSKLPATVRVIPWQPFGWGIDIDYVDGRHHAYPVGPREAAEADAQRLQSGGRV